MGGEVSCTQQDLEITEGIFIHVDFFFLNNRSQLYVLPFFAAAFIRLSPIYNNRKLIYKNNERKTAHHTEQFKAQDGIPYPLTNIQQLACTVPDTSQAVQAVRKNIQIYKYKKLTYKKNNTRKRKQIS